ncbi:hypothetical protein BJ878DRAFT_427148 [Calycina marina]|uniref:Uncharacterized protein n=1 Tax=Calycina marina TaxID=1763456 RepID=A0A9P7YY50_9HELO|nr:hypothetical protein BJ878DRAFT_427148 [Calycina marina]
MDESKQDFSIFVARNVGSATISPSGRDVALASTDGLDIIDLDNPLNPPRHLKHTQAWSVADVQWSPFAARDYWVVSTSSRRAIVWNLGMHEDTAQGAIEHTLKGHTRAITDINFSAHHPDILATCAVDGYVHCWDLRRPRTPVLSFCDWFAGATQVKYNRQDSHVLASSHDRWLRIWDDRKGAVPLKSIDAHESKIYGIDWNRTRPTGIVTCSLDKTIKFWDTGNCEDVPERIIRTDFPVWRARHTPFGWGLLAMPQESPGHLHLYDRRNKAPLDDMSRTDEVKVLNGHGTYKVKEFLWRARGAVTDDGTDNREFQLVSWGDDHELRLHNIDPAILEGVGHVKGAQVRKNINLTRKGAKYHTFRNHETRFPDRKFATITAPRPGSSEPKASALSTGMKKIHLPSSTGTHMTIRPPFLRRMDRVAGDLHQKQIGWMSGIKFSKPESDSAPPGERIASRRLSLLNPGLRDLAEDDEWDAPESLHDEIIRIHEKLPKITFDNVNMDKRTIEASMNGPWGEEERVIYIQVTIHFPEQYPEKVPSFNLGKTSLMPTATYDRLKREVHQVALNHIPHKKGCLEGTLSYLLGEIDLEASTTFFTDVGDIDDLDGLADASSSEDEDTNTPAMTDGILPQGLESSANDDMLTMMSRNANVPMPRQCGARFSANGMLTCFFPSKENKVKTFLKSVLEGRNGRSKGEPFFESFHRLYRNSSTIHRTQAMSSASDVRDDSETPEGSDVSSSSDSDSTQYHMMRFPAASYIGRTTRRSRTKASSAIFSQRSSGAGTNTNSRIGSTLSRARTKARNFVVIHDMSSELPSKVKLAEEYVIFGDGPDGCAHNAKVAELQGYQDLADVWRYVALLLHNEVPLEVLDQNHSDEPVLVIARNSVRHLRRESGSDSGVDVSYDFGRKHLSGRVKWGTNPLAVQVIKDLFSHFEQIADIQMLAMLSCIFNEPTADDVVASNSDIHTTQPQTPLSMKTPAFSLDYFPTDVAAWTMYHKSPVNSAVTTPRLSHTPVGQYGSFGSSNDGPWGSDPASASYSCGETPPLRSNYPSSEHLNRQAHSLSTSPDNPRLFKRANSALTSGFSASLSRPFSVMSSSPPNLPPQSRKRPSPVGSMLASFSASSSAVTWGNTTVLGSVKEQLNPDGLEIQSQHLSKGRAKSGAVMGISVTLKNQNAFDDEGCMTKPLLDPTQTAHFENYRKAYAELLYSWGHPLARLEILKFNGLKDFVEVDIPDDKSPVESILSTSTHTMAHSPPPSPSPMGLGKKSISIPTSSPVGGQCLDATGYCLKHERRLEPLSQLSIVGGAVGVCPLCKVIQRRLHCTICLQPLSGVYTPCLSCGCANHQQCLELYHSGGNTMCPGGCDCDCGQLATDGIVESWGQMISAIERLRALDAENKGTESLDDWNAGGKDEWDVGEDLTTMPSNASTGFGRGYSTLTQRLGRVRTGDWGINGGKKKGSRSLRNVEM